VFICVHLRSSVVKILIVIGVGGALGAAWDLFRKAFVNTDGGKDGYFSRIFFTDIFIVNGTAKAWGLMSN